jgi:Xaa-Pro aminopeptidase
MTVASLRESDWAFRPPESTAIVDGDRIAVTLCASWARYWAEATRTFTVRGDRLELDDDAMVRARFDAAVHRARPGATIADWADTRLAEAAPNEREALHRCGLGHAIGLDVDEAPILSTGDQSAFAAGMCAVVTAAAPSSDGLALRADTIVI